MQRRYHRGFVALVAMLLAAGCTAAEPEVTTPPDDADVYGGFAIDPPAPDDVVLTLEGTTTVDVTMAELEALATTDVRFREPFVGVDQTFTVVPLAELLERAGIGAGDVVDTIALNDYRYRDAVDALIAADALLAVARDGAPIPMNAGGPIRLVFDTDSDYHGFLDAWNWSLRRIAVVESPSTGP